MKSSTYAFHLKGRTVIFLLVLASLGLWLWLARDTGDVETLPSDTRKNYKSSELHQDAGAKSAPGNTFEADHQTDAASAIDQALRSLLASDNRSANEAAIRALSDGLRGMDRKASVMAILRFLNTGRDAPTGLTFAVRPDGSLGGAPTLRVAVLDLLGALDRAEAARYADTIFQRSAQPDEWAVALRDLGKSLGRKAAAASSDYVGHVETLLSRREWLEKPSPGFLHAFDAAVYVGGEQVTAKLVAIHDSRPNQQTMFASRLALDRLALADYATTVAVVRGDPRRLAGDTTDRALILSRANPLVEEHTAAVRGYLGDPGVGKDEKITFLQNFPNANLQVSNNLMTANPMLMMANTSAGDEAALKLMAGWRQEAELELLHAELLNRIAELKEFLNRN